MNNKYTGLSTGEAITRQEKFGFNELPKENTFSFWRSLYDVVTEPIFGLLILAGLIYLIIGSIKDALTLMGFIAISIGITVYQQQKSKKAIQALKDLSSPKSIALRDGLLIKISSREIVVDDILVIKEGDRIPADAKIIECNDFLVDESLLSGESESISKSVNDKIYSGCMATRGSAYVQVQEIGINTELGKIGESLAQIKETKSPLQLDIAALIKKFATFGFGIAILVFLIYGLLYQDWLKGALTGISLTMALLPEEFSVILTVFMALGAWRISKKHVLTRYAPVIETLGSIDTLCVDKTGTLTENRMSLQCLATTDEIFELNNVKADQLPKFNELLNAAVLASEIEPFDPMEIAFHNTINKLFPNQVNLFPNNALVHEYGLSPELPAMTHLWEIANKPNMYYVAIKGSPEAVIKLCQISGPELKIIEDQLKELASQGMRVLGIAHAYFTKTEAQWPSDIKKFEFKWLGLAGLKDPLRNEIPLAIKECQNAGIRIVMITGDHALTAQSIAKQAGIDYSSVLSGTDIQNMSDTELRQAVNKTSVFVRIKPDQKLRLVNALKDNKNIVAMTGDGINDAPALKAAHVGISMGLRGTDVAREASSLVLLDDNFSSIVNAIKQGRQIYDNLLKAIIYIIAVHIPIAGSIFIPILIGMPPLLTPIHILLLEMIIDPACSIVFEMEPPEGNLMNRAPRDPNSKIFSLTNISLAALQGLGLLVAILAIYIYLPLLGYSLETTVSVSFASLVLGNLLLIITNRSQIDHLFKILSKPNSSQNWIVGLTLGTFILLFSSSDMREYFHLTAISYKETILIFTSGVICLTWFEASKWLIKKLIPIKNNGSITTLAY